MSKQDLLFMDEFAVYRQSIIEEGVVIASEVFKSPNPDFIKGAMFMLKRILQIPKKYATTDKAQVQVDIILEKDFKEFHSRFVKVLYDEG